MRQGMKHVLSVFQCDWVPDFDDWRMKDAGIILRFRYMRYTFGDGPKWLVTIKLKDEHKKTHYNRELEASSINPERLSMLSEVLAKRIGTTINLERVLNKDTKYCKSLGLVSHRMLLEKQREEYSNSADTVHLSIDLLPPPLGHFAEIEVNDDLSVILDWEKRLNINSNMIEVDDYGSLVKKLDPIGNRRTLTFER